MDHSIKKDLVKKPSFFKSKSKKEKKEAKHSQQISELSPVNKTLNIDEINEIFEKLLDDMNIPETKRNALRLKPIEIKAQMINNSLTAQKRPTTDYIGLLNQILHGKLSEHKICENLDAVRICLNTCPVSDIKVFNNETNDGLNLLLTVLNFVIELPEASVICLRCFRVFANCGYGLFKILENERAYISIARCLKPYNVLLMYAAVELLTILTFYSQESYQNVMNGLFQFSKLSAYESRFSVLIEGLKYTNIENENESLAFACSRFINVIINPKFVEPSSQSLDEYFRLHLRKEFVNLGVLEIFNELLLNDRLKLTQEQINIFLQEYETEEEEVNLRSEAIVLAFNDTTEIFRILNRCLSNTKCEKHLRSILSSLAIIRDDPIRDYLFQFVDEVVSEIILQDENGFCPDPMLRKFDKITVRKFTDDVEVENLKKALDTERLKKDEYLMMLEMYRAKDKAGSKHAIISDDEFVETLKTSNLTEKALSENTEDKVPCSDALLLSVNELINKYDADSSQHHIGEKKMKFISKPLESHEDTLSKTSLSSTDQEDLQTPDSSNIIMNFENCEVPDLTPILKDDVSEFETTAEEIVNLNKEVSYNESLPSSLSGIEVQKDISFEPLTSKNDSDNGLFNRSTDLPENISNNTCDKLSSIVITDSASLKNIDIPNPISEKFDHSSSEICPTTSDSQFSEIKIDPLQNNLTQLPDSSQIPLSKNTSHSSSIIEELSVNRVPISQSLLSPSLNRNSVIIPSDTPQSLSENTIPLLHCQSTSPLFGNTDFIPLGPPLLLSENIISPPSDSQPQLSKNIVSLPPELPPSAFENTICLPSGPLAPPLNEKSVPLSSTPSPPLFGIPVPPGPPPPLFGNTVPVPPGPPPPLFSDAVPPGPPPPLFSDAVPVPPGPPPPLFGNTVPVPPPPPPLFGNNVPVPPGPPPPLFGNTIPVPPPPPPLFGNTIPVPPPPPGVVPFGSPPPPPPLLHQLAGTGFLLPPGPPPPPGCSGIPNQQFSSTYQKPPSILQKLGLQRAIYEPQMPMKKANWNKINEKNLCEKSIWMTIKEESIPMTILKELEENFSNKPITEKVSSNKAGSSIVKKLKELKVLDGKTAQNISILLGSLRMDYNKLRQAILEINTAILTQSMIEQLLKNLPEPEQMQIISELKDPYDDLSESEQFCFQLSGIKQLKPRLESILFKLKFDDKINEVKSQYYEAEMALKEIKESGGLKKIIELVLSLGNYMNSGSRNQQSIGFEVNFLCKLSSTKDKTNNRSLIHFLAEIIEKTFFNPIDLTKELSHIERASRISLDVTASILAEIKKESKAIENQLKTFKPSAADEDKFFEIMAPFVNTVKEQIVVSERFQTKMADAFVSVSEYFSFNRATYKMEDLFNDMTKFLEEFMSAHKANKEKKLLEERALKTKLEKERREQQKLTKKISQATNEEDSGVLDNLLAGLKTDGVLSPKRRKPKLTDGRHALDNRSRSRGDLVERQSVKMIQISS